MTTQRGQLADRFDALGDARDSSPALSKVILPEPVWPQIRERLLAPDDELDFRPIALLALERGYLHRLTQPIERLLMDQGDVRPECTSQYRRDLQETWFLQRTPLQRLAGLSKFQGRTAELHVALQLEEAGWILEGVEALGGAWDISARHPELGAVDFEVKRIGASRDAQVAHVAAARTGITAFHSDDPYEATNYLLSRIAEAGRQLANSSKKKIVVVVFEEDDYHGAYDFPFGFGFIDPEQPRFHPGEEGWKKFAADSGFDPAEAQRQLGIPSETWFLLRNKRLVLEGALSVSFP